MGQKVQKCTPARQRLDRKALHIFTVKKSFLHEAPVSSCSEGPVASIFAFLNYLFKRSETSANVI